MSISVDRFENLFRFTLFMLSVLFRVRHNLCHVCFRVRTPGGRLVYQYLKKPKRVPKCGNCKIKLHGIKPARAIEKSRMCKRKKTVKRAYGGVLCHSCVREKYVLVSS